MNKLLENVLEQAIRTNPKAMEMLAEWNKSGMSAQEFFYKKAEEKGIDPKIILSQLNM